MATETITGSGYINSRISLPDIEEELLIVMRNNLTDRRDRTSYDTDSFTGDGSTTIFEFTTDLDSKNRHKVMNVKWVKIDGVEQTNYSDYAVGYTKDSPILGKVQFWNPPEDGASIEVYLGHTYHFIYPGKPRVDLSSNNYPRISIDLMKVDTEERCLGGIVQSKTIPVQFTIIDEKRDYVQNLTSEILRFFTLESNKHRFHFFSFIQKGSPSPIIQNGEDPNDVVYQQQIDFEIPNQYEISR